MDSQGNPGSISKGEWKKDQITVIRALENASIHKTSVIRKFVENHPRIRLLHLPPYSPGHNPIEQVWHWIKPLVHAVRTINGDIQEILDRFRKIIWAKNHDRLAAPMNIGLGIWKSLL